MDAEKDVTSSQRAIYHHSVNKQTRINKVCVYVVWLQVARAGETQFGLLKKSWTTLESEGIISLNLERIRQIWHIPWKEQGRTWGGIGVLT